MEVASRALMELRYHFRNARGKHQHSMAAPKLTPTPIPTHSGRRHGPLRTATRTRYFDQLWCGMVWYGRAGVRVGTAAETDRYATRSGSEWRVQAPILTQWLLGQYVEGGGRRSRPGWPVTAPRARACSARPWCSSARLPRFVLYKEKFCMCEKFGGKKYFFCFCFLRFGLVATL